MQQRGGQHDPVGAAVPGRDRLQDREHPGRHPEGQGDPGQGRGPAYGGDGGTDGEHLADAEHRPPAGTALEEREGEHHQQLGAQQDGRGPGAEDAAGTWVVGVAATGHVATLGRPASQGEVDRYTRSWGRGAQWRP